MNDDQNHGKLEMVGDEGLEARVVAWVLGEASAFEASELEAMEREMPEVELFARRIRMLDGLLREKERVPMRLPAEKRAKVSALFGGERTERRVRSGRAEGERISVGRRLVQVLGPWAAVASIAVALWGMTVPLGMNAGRKSESAAVVTNHSGLEEDESEAVAVGPFLSMGKKQETQVMRKPSEPTSSMSKVVAAQTAAPSAIPVPDVVAQADSFGDGSDFGDGWAEAGGRIAGNRSNDRELRSSAIPFYNKGEGRQKWRSDRVSDERALGVGRDELADSAKRGEAVQKVLEHLFKDSYDIAEVKPQEADRSRGRDRESDPLDQILRNQDLTMGHDAIEVLTKAVKENPSEHELRLILKKYRAEYQTQVTDMLRNPDKAKFDETDQQLFQLGEITTAEEAFSTFSLQVNDASFRLAAAAMERGEVPEAAGIRAEEFYNAFDYGDPAPGEGEPVVCVFEQAGHPFAAQRNLLRLAVRTGSAGRGASTPLNLTILLDQSGSMQRADRTEAVDRAVGELSGLLNAGDQVSVVGFARTPQLLVDRLAGERSAELPSLLQNGMPEGGTNLEEALELGEKLAERQYAAGAQNRVVLFTDGAANLGDADPESLQKRVERMRQNGIAFDAAGFGSAGLNDRMLERLARNGNGRYLVVGEAGEADQSFAQKMAGAFRPAAEDVKVQVVFNPERVRTYRLIGFEEHRLTKEQFRDDTVDAAEMAAEEAGVALYQMEIIPEGRGEVGEVRVRFRDAGTGEMVERNWIIPYEAQAPAFDLASEKIQLATLAALAAEKLQGRPMGLAADFADLWPVMRRVTARYPESDEVKRLQGMIEKLKF